ncbi:hypothetical protein F3056_13275 [Akkermansia sp. BIOML-A66]|uniref:hypothetical protein n=1 Tax=Akkermansia sp. BIOML-A66 TaxID=2584622 RepID=UPI00122F990C|nr:hypothetical protein [Akkermansia sp. BIOML-A66]KAB1287041.1 hypothetical protein F3056_13275 [Akkermansia sp. BIOML-A66]
MTTYLITFRITTRDGSSNSYQQRRKEFDDLLASYAPKKFPLETDNNSSTSTYIIHEDEPDLGEISIQCIEEIPDLIDSVKNFFEKYRSEFEDSFILLKIDSSNMVVHSMRMDEGKDISDGPGINCLD